MGRRQTHTIASSLYMLFLIALFLYFVLARRWLIFVLMTCLQFMDEPIVSKVKD